MREKKSVAKKIQSDNKPGQRCSHEGYTDGVQKGEVCWTHKHCSSRNVPHMLESEDYVGRTAQRSRTGTKGAVLRGVSSMPKREAFVLRMVEESGGSFAATTDVPTYSLREEYVVTHGAKNMFCSFEGCVNQALVVDFALRMEQRGGLAAMGGVPIKL